MKNTSLKLLTLNHHHILHKPPSLPQYVNCKQFPHISTLISSCDRIQLTKRKLNWKLFFSFCKFPNRITAIREKLAINHWMQWYFTIPYELLTSDLYTSSIECAWGKKKTSMENLHLNVLQVVRQANKVKFYWIMFATAIDREAH